ncbi:MarR family winged helix-turn-helix transcriptional regulator [Nocardia niwae]|uniref:MarR family winged helix-turn-helix transcriptional regulator n=1 Tax=Nocardia niwae TaxID=626084 RepID=UPI0007A3A4A0|nr:MarR family winged helix-turn-helix transcriptional regulator [Nocardia niwae]
MHDNDPGSDVRQQAWAAFVSLSAHLRYAVNAQLRHECGLTHIEFRILHELADQPQHRLGLSALAFGVDSSRSRLTCRLDGLERRGLVKRTSGVPDKRAKEAVLTAAGWAAYEAAIPVHEAIVRTLVLDVLSDDDVAEWLRLTRRMLARVVAREEWTSREAFQAGRKII